MAAIDIGPGAIYNSTYLTISDQTIIVVTNPANAEGVLTMLELYPKTPLYSVTMGCGYMTGGAYPTYDADLPYYTTLGDVAAGSKQTFTGLSVLVSLDYYLALYASSGSICVGSGDAANYRASGYGFGTTLTYSNVSHYPAISIYGEGDYIDRDPNAFELTDKTNVQAKAVVESDPLEPTGFNFAAKVTITNGEYKIGSGSWTSNDGYIYPGQSITVRHTAASTRATDTDTTLGLGTDSPVYDTFTSTTADRPVNITALNGLAITSIAAYNAMTWAAIKAVADID